MTLEDYLIEQGYQINAINRICKLINAYIENNYDRFSDKYLIEELKVMNCIIQQIAYCMRLRRYEHYKNIDENYDENLDYNSIMYDVFR